MWEEWRRRHDEQRKTRRAAALLGCQVDLPPLDEQPAPLAAWVAEFDEIVKEVTA